MGVRVVRAHGEVRRHSDIDIATRPRGALPLGFLAEIEAEIGGSTNPAMSMQHADPTLVTEIECEGLKWRD